MIMAKKRKLIDLYEEVILALSIKQQPKGKV